MWIQLDTSIYVTHTGGWHWQKSHMKFNRMRKQQTHKWIILRAAVYFKRFNLNVITLSTMQRRQRQHRIVCGGKKHFESRFNLLSSEFYGRNEMNISLVLLNSRTKDSHENHSDISKTFYAVSMLMHCERKEQTQKIQPIFSEFSIFNSTSCYYHSPSWMYKKSHLITFIIFHRYSMKSIVKIPLDYHELPLCFIILRKNFSVCRHFEE